MPRHVHVGSSVTHEVTLVSVRVGHSRRVHRNGSDAGLGKGAQGGGVASSGRGWRVPGKVVGVLLATDLNGCTRRKDLQSCLGVNSNHLLEPLLGSATGQRMRALAELALACLLRIVLGTLVEGLGVPLLLAGCASVGGTSRSGGRQGLHGLARGSNNASVAGPHTRVGRGWNAAHVSLELRDQSVDAEVSVEHIHARALQERVHVRVAVADQVLEEHSAHGTGRVSNQRQELTEVVRQGSDGTSQVVGSIRGCGMGENTPHQPLSLQLQRAHANGAKAAVDSQGLLVLVLLPFGNLGWQKCHPGNEEELDHSGLQENLLGGVGGNRVVLAPRVLLKNGGQSGAQRAIKGGGHMLLDED